ncbi:MAG TPA: hypothetical protein ENI68_04830, partial [Gammaproteobacteria bacterium]|nr:hypothetical protein [Gammaproteobacteria bacterium]
MQISEQGKRLPKSVEIRSFNRPVKVAFLVPIEENQISHWILDGIFYEAYSRWGGAHSLIIPFQDGRPLHDNYMPWLSCLDPDFVYSFVEIDELMISEINQQVMPIEMIKHEILGKPDRWRQFIPKWPHGFKPVHSISTLTSPTANYPGWLDKPSPQVYITQSYENDAERFLPNNFGVAHDTSTVTYGQSGVFETMCYCAKDIPENNIVGNYRSDN